MSTYDSSKRLMLQLLDAVRVIGTTDSLSATGKVTTPCIPRPDTWFKEHFEAILAEADAACPSSERPEIRGIMLGDVMAQYVRMAASGILTFTYNTGCRCGNLRTCSVVLYKRALLVAIRRRVKEEEEAKMWPRDL